MNNNLPIIAIVGQPNAGKSTLMNKIAGKPLAVTSDVAGTTRDRQYIDTIWSGVTFTLVDTAGLTFGGSDELELNIAKQIEVALAEADAVIFVVDGKEPVGAVDSITIKKFRNTDKPLLLCVNKLDSARTHDEKLREFSRLGIKPAFGVSSLTGLGIGDMLDAVISNLPRRLSSGVAPEESLLGTDDKSIAVSIVGKPNVGKSSIFNKILKEERVVVSPTPGTTRTAIDSNITIGDVNYTFIDTAGLKKKEFRQAEPDIFSGFQTFKAIRRSDVCFFVIDANDEITKQDQRIANEIFNMQKGCIILANKIDLVKPSVLDKKKKSGYNKKTTGRLGERKDDDYNSVRDYVSSHFPFMWMCPMFFVSALDGKGIDEALSAIMPIHEARNKTIDDATMKTFLAKMMKINPPKLLRDQKKPKVLGLKQIETNPPKFELLVNHPAAISSQFRKFVENGIIKDLGFWGTQIVFKLRGKDKA